MANLSINMDRFSFWIPKETKAKIKELVKIGVIDTPSEFIREATEEKLVKYEKYLGKKPKIQSAVKMYEH